MTRDVETPPQGLKVELLARAVRAILQRHASQILQFVIARTIGSERGPRVV